MKEDERSLMSWLNSQKHSPKFVYLNTITRYQLIISYANFCAFITIIESHDINTLEI